MAELETYNPAKSPTAQIYPNEKFSINYLHKTEAEGPVYRDTLVIGGATIPQMPFGLATKINFPKGRSGSGRMGLAFRSNSKVTPDHQRTVMEIMQPSLSQPVFTTNLKVDDTGELWLRIRG